jgi:ribose transport system substrate-binding protein
MLAREGLGTVPKSAFEPVSNWASAQAREVEMRERQPKHRRARRFAGLGAALALVAIAATALFSAGASASSKGRTASSKKPYTFVLSNNFLGNDWRPQVERLAKLTANVAPFKGNISLKVVNSADTVQAQISDLNNIIQTKPNVLLVIPGSTTAENPTLQRACNAGILVFTLSAPVSLPCVYNLNQSFYDGNEAMGQWMAKVLHGQGNVFIDQGVAGVDVSGSIEDGFLAGMKKYGPNIKVAGTYVGNYAAGPEQTGITNLLASHPDVNGIMTEGYCTPVFNALKAAGKSSVPAVCYGYNGEMEACASGGHECAVLTNTPAQVQLAMKMALNLLHGGKPPKHGKTLIPYPMYLYVSAQPKVTLDVKGLGITAVQTLKSGVNYFPKLASGLSLPYTLPQYAKEITPQQAAG